MNVLLNMHWYLIPINIHRLADPVHMHLWVRSLSRALAWDRGGFWLLLWLLLLLILLLLLLLLTTLSPMAVGWFNMSRSLKTDALWVAASALFFVDALPAVKLAHILAGARRFFFAVESKLCLITSVSMFSNDLKMCDAISIETKFDHKSSYSLL